MQIGLAIFRKIPEDLRDREIFSQSGSQSALAGNCLGRVTMLLSVISLDDLRESRLVSVSLTER